MTVWPHWLLVSPMLSVFGNDALGVAPSEESAHGGHRMPNGESVRGGRLARGG